MPPKAAKTGMKIGQKKATPDPRDSLYLFYTSLHKQRPKSKMALKWCLEHGVFGPKKAEKIHLQLEMERLSLKSDKATA